MAKPKGDIEIGYRMTEELYRIFDTQAEAARRIGGHRHNLRGWMNGDCPNAFWLARLYYLGGDVIYVLTGKRSVKDGK